MIGRRADDQGSAATRLLPHQGLFTGRAIAEPALQIQDRGFAEKSQVGRRGTVDDTQILQRRFSGRRQVVIGGKQICKLRVTATGRGYLALEVGRPGRDVVGRSVHVPVFVGMYVIEELRAPGIQCHRIDTHLVGRGIRFRAKPGALHPSQPVAERYLEFIADSDLRKHQHSALIQKIRALFRNALVEEVPGGNQYPGTQIGRDRLYRKIDHSQLLQHSVLGWLVRDIHSTVSP